MTVPAYPLLSGHSLPVLGLGTWRITGEEHLELIRAAVRLGYRHLDTAEFYGNEEALGEALAEFDRASLYLTSKVYYDHLRHDEVLAACERSLRALRTDYLDLYLIHWPHPEVPLAETCAALGRLQEEGLVRSVGVSNFTAARVEEALAVSPVPLCVNQVEFHPLLYQRALLEACAARGVVLTAYAPLARGRVAQEPVVQEIAARRAKSPAQVSLRWLLQHGLAVIPKAADEAHLRENLAVFDWRLTPEEMTALDDLGERLRLIHPDFAEF